MGRDAVTRHIWRVNSPIIPAGARGKWPAPQFLDVIEAQRLVYTLCHDRNAGTIVQLIGASTGAGTSTMVRDLALVAARLPNVRVLLLDLEPPGNSQITILRERYGIAVLGADSLFGPPGDVLVHHMALGGLYVTETRLPPGAPTPPWVKIFAALRAGFELVLIDSPPVERSYDGIMLAPEVDSSVLVVEAERTRSAVAQNLRDRILAVGGTISGVMLNKQRFYIPDFIYRHI
jgi:Mrp family chromosome partitioning ATPase